jgi:hypothetical protein
MNIKGMRNLVTYAGESFKKKPGEKTGNNQDCRRNNNPQPGGTDSGDLQKKIKQVIQDPFSFL